VAAANATSEQGTNTEQAGPNLQAIRSTDNHNGDGSGYISSGSTPYVSTVKQGAEQ
jgi:hypothetical protein